MIFYPVDADQWRGLRVLGAAESYGILPGRSLLRVLAVLPLSLSEARLVFPSVSRVRLLVFFEAEADPHLLRSDRLYPSARLSCGELSAARRVAASRAPA